MPIVPAIPVTATLLDNLQAESGWTVDASKSIGSTGEPAPAQAVIQQVAQPPIPQPDALVLATTGVKGKWCDWMAKKTAPVPAGKLNMALVIDFTFPKGSLAGVNAQEFGRRFTDENGYTDNGQTQWVIKGEEMEFDTVPSAKGGWIDTGIRVPLFVEGALNTQVIIYQRNADNSLSVLEVWLNGVEYLVPAALQSVESVKMSPPWAPNEAVIGIQQDAGPSATPYTLNVSRAQVSYW
jgi:hypothetical protein